MAVWINTRDYSPTELVMFGVGAALWIVVYVLTLRNIRRIQFIEIPFLTVCGNIVWEFLWSWVFETDMGLLFQWGYRIWFFLDCLIVAATFRYAYKQISIEVLRGRAHLLVALGIVLWTPLLYFYIRNYDAPLSHMGAYSGYVLNIAISALYIPLALRLNDWSLFSLPAAWAKGVGTGLISVFCFLHFTDWFLLAMCLVTGCLDAAYVLLFNAYGRPATAPPPTAAAV